jgi:hypothetical protein
VYLKALFVSGTRQEGFFMGRVAQSNTKKIILSVVVVVGLITAGGAAITAKNTSDNPKPVTASKQMESPAAQTTQLSYNGEEGKDVLTLLKEHAKVETKHYDFGDLVTSVNGTKGNGPKYWSLYVNGKLSEVGASSYVTKDADKIEWKLQ